MNVLNIPELFFAILGYLDKTSLAKCSLVCRAWREPATKLMWAQVQDLEQLMSKSIPDRTLKQFKHHHLYRLMTLPHPELVPRPEEDAETPERSSLADALHYFRQLDVDWANETALFRKRTQRITHLRITHSNLFNLLVLYLLQDSYPSALQGIFPRLTALTLEGNHPAPLISQSITKFPSIRHITFETIGYGPRFRSPHLPSWRLACQPATGLVSFSINFVGGSNEPPWAETGTAYPPLLLSPFVLTRPWKHIGLPGRIVGNHMFSTLASIESLETLTITDSLRSFDGYAKHRGSAFKSLHTLRLLNVTTGEDFFKGLVLPSVQNLELEFSPDRREGVNFGSAVSYLAAMIQACPNASSVMFHVKDRPLIRLSALYSDSEDESDGLAASVDIFPDSAFEPLLTLGSLERLVVRLPSKSSVILSDDFLGRAARSWPHLRELDMDQPHSTQTAVTLQGLVPLARHCPKLSTLQLGIQPSHIHTVFNAELYMRENGGMSGACALTYLNIGCPPVYSAEAVAAFFSTLFPNLRRIECPTIANSDLYSRADYFVWSQVVRTIHERDRDLDNLARMLRARDLTEKHELANRDFIFSSIDDSDEDYWAYSGSEDESYSSDDE